MRASRRKAAEGFEAADGHDDRGEGELGETGVWKVVISATGGEEDDN